MMAMLTVYPNSHHSSSLHQHAVGQLLLLLPLLLGVVRTQYI
jgi:hypothetical protein